MEELITSIYKTLQDYRADEENPAVQMTKKRIRAWINQFDEELRIPILTELDSVFKKRYLNKKHVRNFLKAIVERLTKDFKFESPKDFLENSIFLDLQQEGKSQKVMLKLFNELLEEEYGIGLKKCGKTSKKYSIYLDDILCTGQTLINNVIEWSEQKFSKDKTNKEAVADNSTTLVLAYVFIHEKNYFKKVSQMKHSVSKELSSKHKMYRMVEIENKVVKDSKIDLILPIENEQPKKVNEYKESIIEEVDVYTKSFDGKSPDEFFRPENLPEKEAFFTSKENRILIENAFLNKGIKILKNANATNKNMRALGYSIPSSKNFGFGALCFTWRNVPNNAPLVFWYAGGGFTPLFVKNQTNNP
jgi:hypothetical protein